MIREQLATIAREMDGHFERYYIHEDCPWTARWVVVSEGGLSTKRRLVRPILEGSRQKECEKIHQVMLDSLEELAKSELSLAEREGMLWIRAQARSWHHTPLADLCGRVLAISDARIWAHSCNTCLNEITQKGEKIVLEHLNPLIQSIQGGQFVEGATVEQLYDAVQTLPLILTKEQQLSLWKHTLSVGDCALQEKLEEALERHAIDLNFATQIAQHITEEDRPFATHVINVLKMGYRGLSESQLEGLSSCVLEQIENGKQTFSFWREGGMTWHGMGGEAIDPASQFQLTFLREEPEELDRWIYGEACPRTEVLDPCVWQVPSEGRTVTFSYVDGRPVLSIADDGSGNQSAGYVQLPITTIREGVYSGNQVLTEVGVKMRDLSESLIEEQLYPYEKQREWEDYLYGTWFDYLPLFNGMSDPVLADYLSYTLPERSFHWANINSYRMDFVQLYAGRFDLWQEDQMADNARKSMAPECERLQYAYELYRQSDLITLA